MPDSRDAFKIALLGNFSGRPAQVPTPVEIHPDNFEEVMQRLGVSVELAAGKLEFRELDDFHPDQIYQMMPLFRALHEIKQEAASGKSAGAAAGRTAPERPLQAASGSLLDEIVEGSSASSPGSPRYESSWDETIRKIVEPHTIAGPDPRKQELIAQIDRAAAEQMRAILHDPGFQALEAAWRSVFLLFQQIETGVDLKIYLIDIRKEDLATLEIKDGPWSLLAGLYAFSPDKDDCDLLARLGAMARQAGAPFLAAAKSADGMTGPNWQDLRRSPDACWLGLAAPRFLLRLPYGEKTSPIDSFDFEEMPGAPEHESYLWGNPAVACACLLGQAFNRDGWQMQPGTVRRIDSMPVHCLPDGEATPPAEIWMTDRLASQMLNSGVMPLASVKNLDAVQLVRFQSISDPPQALSGPW